MRKKSEKTRDAILLRALPAVPFEGWTIAMAEQATREAGYDTDMFDAVFPKGIDDFVKHFADWADRQMLKALEKEDMQNMRVRDRIKLAVQTRIEILNAYKEAERATLAYWMRPLRKYKGAQVLWRTSDRIWLWAGDTSTDYNRYTKRGLLSGVIASTMMAWMSDSSNESGDDLSETLDFLDRRIDNVMTFGKVLNRFKRA